MLLPSNKTIKEPYLFDKTYMPSISVNNLLIPYWRLSPLQREVERKGIVDKKCYFKADFLLTFLDLELTMHNITCFLITLKMEKVGFPVFASTKGLVGTFACSKAQP